MSEPIEFYFDFTSPYGYLMSEKIDELAAQHGRKVKWRPILLGIVFKTTGAQPLAQVPLKGDYSRRDFARSARFLGIPYAEPATFPIATQNTARAYYWLHDRDCGAARQFAHAAFRAYFVDGGDINNIDVIQGLAQKVGVGDTAALQEALGSLALKDRLRHEVEAAIARGVCGSPYIMIDGEPFLGVDRLPQIEKWLESGGF